MSKEKKISQAKQRMLANYEEQKSRFAKEGYEERQEIISVLKANLMAFVTAGPFAVLEIVIWILVRMRDAGEGSWTGNDLLAFWAMFFASIFIHELLHGVGWSIFAKGKWKSIHIGMMWEVLTPYCHCKEPLRPKEYLVGAVMPFAVLGVGVFIAALASGNGLLCALSVVNILSAGGDTTLICMLFPYLKKNNVSYMLDHPTECGFTAFIKE